MLRMRVISMERLCYITDWSTMWRLLCVNRLRCVTADRAELPSIRRHFPIFRNSTITNAINIIALLAATAMMSDEESFSCCTIHIFHPAHAIAASGSEYYEFASLSTQKLFALVFINWLLFAEKIGSDLKSWAGAGGCVTWKRFNVVGKCWELNKLQLKSQHAALVPSPSLIRPRFSIQERFAASAKESISADDRRRIYYENFHGTLFDVVACKNCVINYWKSFARARKVKRKLNLVLLARSHRFHPRADDKVFCLVDDPLKH